MIPNMCASLSYLFVINYAKSVFLPQLLILLWEGQHFSRQFAKRLFVTGSAATVRGIGLG